MNVSDVWPRVTYTESGSYLHACIAFYGVLLPVACLLGIPGNMVTIYIMATTNTLFNETSRRFFLILACTDLIFLWTGGAFALLQGLNCHSYIEGGLSYDLATWEHLEIVMKVVYAMASGFTTGSFMVVIAISIERYLLTCHFSGRFSKLVNPKNNKITLGMIAVLAALYAISSAFETNEMAYWNPRLSDNSTYESFHNLTVPSAYCPLFYYNPTLLVIGICIIVSINLKLFHTFRHQTSKNTSQQDLRRQTKMVLILVAVLLLTGLPRAVYAMTWPFMDSSLGIKYLRMITGFGFITNASANFILYLVMNRDFKQTLMKFIKLA